MTCRSTLRNCALVCRDWLPASRHALFSDVELQAPDMWDLFLERVVNVGARGNAAFRDPLASHEPPGEAPMGSKVKRTRKLDPGVRGQYVIPVLAGSLPKLECLTLSGLDWDWNPSHRTTFGMFSQFTSLRRLTFVVYKFPSFCSFRCVLVSLPALEDLNCLDVHWPSAPQPSILALQSGRPALRVLFMSFVCRACAFALLEWLIHTPISSTLVDIGLRPLWGFKLDPPPEQHDSFNTGRKLSDVTQVLAHSICVAHLFQAEMLEDMPYESFWSGFSNLETLDLKLNPAERPRTADMLRALPARIHTLIIRPTSSRDPALRVSDHLIEEDGEIKAMRTNGLELLDSVMSRDNFKDLTHLSFEISGLREVLTPVRESTMEAIQRKLPTMHHRGCLDLQLHFFDDQPAPSSFSES
ncbi:hypothetical protein V8D89_015506 [Ganoderma adspersum]